MTSNKPLLFALLTVAAACATTEPRVIEPAASAQTSPSSAPATQGAAPSYSVQDAAGAPQEAPPAPEAQRDYSLHGGDTNLWRDPDFQRRFVESYLAETDIEPRVNIDETESLQKIAESISDGRMDRAIARLKKDGGPKASAVFDFTLGNIYFQQEEFELAAAAYNIAVDKYPKFRRAWKNLGLIHVRQGEHRAAGYAFTQVIELGGGDALTYGLLGFAYTNTDKPIAAESAYRMATLLDPLTLDWKLGLARSFFKQRRYGDAATLCGELIADQPNSADLWLLQGNAFIGMNQPLRAAENFEFVERLGASTPASLNNLGDIYINEKLFELAVTAYVRAMELDREGDVSRAVRAAGSLTANAAFDDVRRLIAAIEDLHGDLLLPAERKNLLKIKSRIAVAQGMGGEEAEILKEIVEMDPLDGDALVLLGDHSARYENVEEAIFYYERAAGIDGFEARAKKSHGQLLVTQGRYSDALPLLRRVVFLEPTDGLKVYIDQVERLARTSGGDN